MAPIIRVIHLTKRFDRVRALSDVSLEVMPGDSVALWGPNGAGKTTLLRCLLGIVPYTGTIQVLGLDPLRQGRAVRSQVGYVPQQIRLHPDQTVWETIVFYARLRGVGPARAAGLLNAWGLAGVRDAPVQHLSGGMKQRLMLTIALLSDPPILLLDEPTSHLDLVTRRDFDDALAALRASGRTLVFCSHRLSEVQRLAERIIGFKAGVKTLDGDTSALHQVLDVDGDPPLEDQR